MPIYRLTPTYQTYSWGKKGESSLVAKLLELQNLDQQTPYAELWLGAHPKSPSLIERPLDQTAHLERANHKEPLDEFLAKNSLSLSSLFKILSIAEPLSIQAHPNRERAVELHAADPANYPDTNHKPEIAVALSEVKLLWDFRSQAEIEKLISKMAELQQLLAITSNNSNKDPRKTLFNALLSLNKEAIAKLTRAIYSSLTTQKNTLDSNEELFIEFARRYGEDDLGVLLSLALNIITLQPREAIYTPPGTLHAYLSGDLAECMACSDNVVRGGLTNKKIDLETLKKVVSFEDQGEPKIINGTEKESGIWQYPVPVADFKLFRAEVSQTSYSINIDSTTLFFVIAGGTIIKKKENAQVVLKQGEGAIALPTEKAYELKLASNENSQLFYIK
ncbi:MAG TPA: mannose-6-phosphate isomerase, class I [Oligoflexia bacterium]|nr:mannose-6-phosphate isomerase, class I [Oligoflexia bacterium]HMP27030.1 mannose-6-phosphate isomerase, class I [Oligoflexia bacterium]